MGETLAWGGSLAGGAIIGLLYFGGLWATVRRLPSSRRPALLALFSFAARSVMAVAGFALLLAGDARRIALALAGFLAVRVAAVRLSHGRADFDEGR